MEPQLVFISYINRSGSTLLCKVLDQYEEISVGIEAGFPGYMTKLIPDEYKEINNDASLEKYLDELFGDIRFAQWKIDREKLIKRLHSSEYPLTFKEILTACLHEYFGKATAKVFVHKAGFYVDMLNDVRQAFGPAKNLFIIRDPRAIYNSQKNATCIYTGKSMGCSLPYFINQYKKRTRLVRENLKNKDFYCVKYEDLVQDNEKVMNTIFTFLNLRNPTRGSNCYSEKIPDNQKSLHTNVGSDPNKNSLEKWITGLEKHEVHFIQKQLREEMEFFDYQPDKLAMLSLPSWMDYLKNKIPYVYLQLRNTD